MKKILFVGLSALFTNIVIAQVGDTLYFKLSIDSCVKKTTILNSATREFSLAVKNSLAVLPLLKQDDIEIGIKIYVNQVTEDEKVITIVKLLIMEKDNDNWKTISSSGYNPLEELGYPISVKIGSDKEIPDFFIQYKLCAVLSEKQQNKQGILDLIPVLKEKVKNH